MKNPEVTALQNRIKELRDQLSDAERRLEQIKATCKHYLVKMPAVTWERDSFDLGVDTRLGGTWDSGRSCCEICGKIV